MKNTFLLVILISSFQNVFSCIFSFRTDDGRKLHYIQTRCAGSLDSVGNVTAVSRSQKVIIKIIGKRFGPVVIQSKMIDVSFERYDDGGLTHKVERIFPYEDLSVEAILARVGLIEDQNGYYKNAYSS